MDLRCWLDLAAASLATTYSEARLAGRWRPVLVAISPFRFPHMSEPGWELVLAFPDQSSSFCYGFEAGQIWERMKAGERIEQTVNDENREMYVRMAQAKGWRAEFERINDDGWEMLILTPPRELARDP